MPVFRYANIYLGLAMIFNARTDLVDCELAWSPDTVHWHRVCPGTLSVAAREGTIFAEPRGPFCDSLIAVLAPSVERWARRRLGGSEEWQPAVGWRRGNGRGIGTSSQ